MVELFANSEDPDQMLRCAASDLGLHCLSITLSGVSGLQCVKHVPDHIYICCCCFPVLILACSFLVFWHQIAI